jgi:formate dehydrogenase maturation protein FdhE
MKNFNIKKTKEHNLPGYINVPYVLSEHTKESLKSYNDFMEEYEKKHEVCPKCGSKPHTSTLVGYILNSDKPEEYKDLNRCTCTSCGNVHTCHDRISEEEYKNKLNL